MTGVTASYHYDDEGWGSWYLLPSLVSEKVQILCLGGGAFVLVQ